MMMPPRSAGSMIPLSFSSIFINWAHSQSGCIVLIDAPLAGRLFRNIIKKIVFPFQRESRLMAPKSSEAFVTSVTPKAVCTVERSRSSAASQT